MKICALTTDAPNGIFDHLFLAWVEADVVATHFLLQSFDSVPRSDRPVPLSLRVIILAARTHLFLQSRGPPDVQYERLT